MRPPFYLRQLKRDLDAWIANGWVPEISRQKILDALGAGQRKNRMPAIMAVLGAVLLGAAAMSFVAANWEGMSKLLRLVLLFGAMATGFLASAALVLRGRPASGQAVLLLGVLLFGVNIMLVAQTYHIASGWSGGLLLWAGGALVAAAVVPARAAFSLAIVIGTLWTAATMLEMPHVLHWPFLVFLGLAAALAQMQRWTAEFHLYVLAFFFWLADNLSVLAESTGFSNAGVAATCLAFFLALWLAGRLLEAKEYVHARGLQRYALIAAFVAFFILQMCGEAKGAGALIWPEYWLGFASLASAGIVALAGLAYERGVVTLLDLGGIAVFMIAGLAYPAIVPGVGRAGTELPYLVILGVLIVWAISHGARQDDRVIVNLGFAGFAAWTIYLYVDFFSSLLDQAMFFAVGGVALIALGLILETARRRVLRPSAKEG